MVGVVRYISFLFLLNVVQSTFAQRIETGLKLFYANDAVTINNETLKSYEDSTHSLRSTTENLQAFRGLFVKYYPKSNDLYFSSEIYGYKRSDHYYQSSFSSEKSKISSNSSGKKGDYPESSFDFNVSKIILNLLIGYEFPKTKRYKVYLSGGLNYYRTVFFVSNGVFNDQTSINTALSIQNYYSLMKKNNFGLLSAFGLRHKRFCYQLQLTFDPFIKNTNLITQNKIVMEGSVFYRLYNKNVSRTQYKEKQGQGSKINRSSKARLILSVFSEVKCYNKLSEFQFQDEFLFKKEVFHYFSGAPEGYLKIKITQPPKVLEIPGVGFGYQINLLKHFYFKNQLYVNATEFRYQAGQKIEGGYFSGTSFITEENPEMITQFWHDKFNFLIGYNNSKRNSFFAEAGLVINKWIFRDNWLQNSNTHSKNENGLKTTRGKSSQEFLAYGSMGQKMQLKKQVLGISATIGYKINNLLISLNYNQTLGNFNVSNEYATIGKYSEVKLSLGYQFAKFYFKK